MVATKRQQTQEFLKRRLRDHQKIKKKLPERLRLLVTNNDKIHFAINICVNLKKDIIIIICLSIIVTHRTVLIDNLRELLRREGTLPSMPEALHCPYKMLMICWRK